MERTGRERSAVSQAVCNGPPFTKALERTDAMAEASNSIWHAVLLVFLGWLLGLLGPIVVDAIRKKHRNVEIRNAILAELHEARNRLAATLFLIETRFGAFNRQLLQWLLTVLESYRGPNPNADAIGALRQLLGANDAQLAALAQQAQAPAGGALGVKKYSTRYLDSRLADLGGFSEKAQALLVDIRARFDLYNEEVDQARYFFQLTFQPGITPENHALAGQSVIGGYRNLGSQARQIIERIDELNTLQ